MRTLLQLCVAALPMLGLVTACGQEVELPLRLPLADAGDDQQRLLPPGGLRIGLDARASCDPEGDRILGYQWLLTLFPGGARPTLEHADGLHPSFVATAPGLYSAVLRVHTEDRLSEPDEVLIEVRADLTSDRAPVLPAHDRCGEPLD